MDAVQDTAQSGVRLDVQFRPSPTEKMSTQTDRHNLFFQSLQQIIQ